MQGKPVENLTVAELLREAHKRWLLADACLECNASDVAFWRRVVEFIHECRCAHDR
jgi:hypothetical protein